MIKLALRDIKLAPFTLYIPHHVISNPSTEFRAAVIATGRGVPKHPTQDVRLLGAYLFVTYTRPGAFVVNLHPAIKWSFSTYESNVKRVDFSVACKKREELCDSDA